MHNASYWLGARFSHVAKDRGAIMANSAGNANLQVQCSSQPQGPSTHLQRRVCLHTTRVPTAHHMA